MTRRADPEQALFSEDEWRRVQRLERIARLMDTAIRVPGIGWRLGADSILGLVPGVGDMAGALVGLLFINEARRLGLPNAKLMRMAANLGVDAALGSVPIAGDLFDVYFKSHRRNMQIIREHFSISEIPSQR